MITHRLLRTMLNPRLAGKIFYKKESRTMFQLCQKTTYFAFSQQKKQNQQDSVLQQQIPKTPKKSSIQRLKLMRQQKRQQQYQQKLHSINLTTGSFNPFTAYLWLHRYRFFYVFLGAFLAFLLINENSLFCYKTMGVFQDPFTRKKRFLVVNPYRQKSLENIIISIIEKQVTFLTQQSLDQKNSQLNKALQKKLQTVLSKLSSKYDINFKNKKGNFYNYQIIQSGQNMCLWIVGDQKLFISTKILKSSPQNLQNLILLMHALHSRYLHLQNISFWERWNLKKSSQTQHTIKLEKTFVSNIYTADNIDETIKLLAEKYQQANPQGQHELRQNLSKALKSILLGVSNENLSVQKKSLAEFDLRNRMKEGISLE